MRIHLVDKFVVSAHELHNVHYAKMCKMCKEAYVTLKKQGIMRLYELLEELEDSGRSEDAAVMRWAIFELERRFDIRIGELDEDI